MSIKDRKESKLVRCVKKPIKILIRAGDLCWQSMSGGGGSGGTHVFYGGGGMSCPTPQVGSMSRSSSASSTKSNHGLGKDAWSGRSSISTPVNGARSGAVAPAPVRSHSIHIGRIDENESCHFDGGLGDEFGVNSRSTAYPRSRSCEVPRSKIVAWK